MAHLSLDYCRQLARARRERGMTQSALALAVGCKQSAVSMLESGQPEKLSRESVEKIAKLLGVAWPAEGGGAVEAEGVTGYCPQPACPSNIPYAVQGELLFWPKLQPLARGGRCAFCGELLESRCPHCQAPVAAEGACCAACGGARVAGAPPAGLRAEEWSALRRREIAEWRALLA